MLFSFYVAVTLATELETGRKRTHEQLRSGVSPTKIDDVTCIIFDDDDEETMAAQMPPVSRNIPVGFQKNEQAIATFQSLRALEPSAMPFGQALKNDNKTKQMFALVACLIKVRTTDNLGHPREMNLLQYIRTVRINTTYSYLILLLITSFLIIYYLCDYIEMPW